MADITTQQRSGAQVEAAGKVRQRESEFHKLVSQVEQRHSDLGPAYKGTGASSLTSLVTEWAADAHKLISEFEHFASKLVQTDRTTAASQEEQASQFGRAKTTIRTSI